MFSPLKALQGPYTPTLFALLKKAAHHDNVPCSKRMLLKLLIKLKSSINSPWWTTGLKELKPSTNELKNKIWTKSVLRDDLESAENEFNILSSNYNVDNSLTIRVFSDKKPGTDFKKAEPQLDDVYFITLKEDQNNNS